MSDDVTAPDSDPNGLSDRTRSGAGPLDPNVPDLLVLSVKERELLELHDRLEQSELETGLLRRHARSPPGTTTHLLAPPYPDLLQTRESQRRDQRSRLSFNGSKNNC